MTNYVVYFKSTIERGIWCFIRFGLLSLYVHFEINTKSSAYLNQLNFYSFNSLFSKNWKTQCICVTRILSLIIITNQTLGTALFYSTNFIKSITLLTSLNYLAIGVLKWLLFFSQSIVSVFIFHISMCFLTILQVRSNASYLVTFWWEQLMREKLSFWTKLTCFIQQWQSCVLLERIYFLSCFVNLIKLSGYPFRGFKSKRK